MASPKIIPLRRKPKNSPKLLPTFWHYLKIVFFLACNVAHTVLAFITS
jgi:hypothetical protein